MRVYPLTIEPDDNGTLLVSFVDIPEAHTFTDDEDQITARATDCALTALEGYMKDRRPIPTPSRELTGRAVVLPPLAVAKIELYEAMRNAGVRKAELARRLRWHMPQVDRLLSLRHGSRLEHLEAALTVLDHHLEMRVVRGVDRSSNAPCRGHDAPPGVTAGQRARRARGSQQQHDSLPARSGAALCPGSAPQEPLQPALRNACAACQRSQSFCRPSRSPPTCRGAWPAGWPCRR